MTVNVDHMRRDAFYLFKSAISCIQSPQCSKEDVDMALRNAAKAVEKLAQYEASAWPGGEV